MAIAISVAFALHPGAGPGRASAETSALEWLSLPGVGPVETIFDLAADGGGRIAIADTRGAIIGRADGDRPVLESSRRIAWSGPAARVRFDGEGGVFVAGEQGLAHVDAHGTTRDWTPLGGGQGARAVVALDVRDGWLAVGGPGGLQLAHLDREAVQAAPQWMRVHSGLAAGGVSDVAIGAVTRAGATPVFVVAGGELHLVWLERSDGRVIASPARRQRPPGRPIGEAVRRVRFGPDGRDVIALYTRAAARLVGPPLDVEPAPGEPGGARWQVDHPLLPPAAEITDAALERSQLWLATTTGLLVAHVQAGALDRRSSSGGFDRAAPPAGTRAVAAVVAAGARVFVAAGGSLLRGDPRSIRVVRGALRDRMPRDPALTRVHTRALDYLGLEVGRMDGLWRGAARRGWVPSLQLRGGAEYSSGRVRDYDESFTYGQLSQLNDRNSDRSNDYDAGVTLSWDLADLAFAPESVEVSREARQVIGLRDNVLDEINQLYFDRQRVLQALSAFADWSDPEAAALRLRALELAAGLDGWTGGWFSDQIELPEAARAAWSPDRRETVVVPRPAVIAHPDAPVPIHAGRNDS